MREYLVNILLCCTIHKMLAKTITFTKIVNTVKVVMKRYVYTHYYYYGNAKMF